MSFFVTGASVKLCKAACQFICVTSMWLLPYKKGYSTLKNRMGWFVSTAMDNVLRWRTNESCHLLEMDVRRVFMCRGIYSVEECAVFEKVPDL